MKLKVKLLDKKLGKNYLEVLSFISLICSFLFIVITIPSQIVLKFILVLVYFYFS
jgi:1,4-dihydroxy-2-naphthoate octaprenyltransferase